MAAPISPLLDAFAWIDDPAKPGAYVTRTPLY